MSTKHNLIQERLNLKRAPLDEWNTHEQLCLASAVASSGDQNWMSVSRALKQIVNNFNSRPADWFQSKSCAIQYGKLLESVDTPKRKKRTASERDQPEKETPSTPIESLVKKLTSERITELKLAISNNQKEYVKLKDDLQFLQGSSMDEARIREMWNEIEQEKIRNEQEQIRYDKWLEEREAKKLEIERQWRPNFGLNKSPSVLKAQKAAQEEAEREAAQQPVSQSAPTLITLLDKKPAIATTSLDSPSEKQPMMMSISVPEGTGGKEGADEKDEDEEILADFTDLIRDKFNDEDLEDINSIIMNPEILEDELTEDKPPRDVDDSSQNHSTTDYDKLKIKKLIEDFSCVPEVDAGQTTVAEGTTEQPTGTTLIEDNVTTQVKIEAESLCPVSIDTVEPAESNDSKEESSAVEEKVIQISDESSNANDDKKDQMSDKVEIGEGEESQSVKSSVEDTKDVCGEDSKETRAFQGIQSGNDSSANSEKNSKAAGTVYHVDDSDEDNFEDAKEHHDDSAKTETEAEPKRSEKSSGAHESKSGASKSGDTENVARSAGSVDSDDEVLEVKVSRGTSRKKTLESLKTDTPSSSTRSRDHSENDDNRDATPIRTRSRNSSVVTINEPKPGLSLTKEQDHTFWKGRWEDCIKELHRHKDFLSITDCKTMQDDSYKSIVLRPMNMKMIHKNIENSVSTMPGDIKRDFALMCSNVIMSSCHKKGSKFNEIVYNFMKDGLEIIESNMDVEDAYKSYRKQIKKKL